MSVTQRLHAQRATTGAQTTLPLYPSYPNPPKGAQMTQVSARTRNVQVIRTGCCDATWTGTAPAHCAGCHETFTSTSGFDAHRRAGRCLIPAEIGMVRADRRWPGWSFPGTWRGPVADDQQ